jgi:hypothetical protein
MPDADASLSLFRQRYVTGGMFLQCSCRLWRYMPIGWLAVGERRP